MAEQKKTQKIMKVPSEYRSRSKSSMSEAIHKMRIFTFVFIAVEMVSFILLVVFFYLNLFSFKEILTGEIWMYIAIGVVILNLALLWFGEVRLTHIRQKSDLDASRIIGADVQEAYKFGELGLVVTDDDYCVIWISPLMKERFIDLLDCNLLEWQPELETLLATNSPDENSKDIKIGDVIYNVKCLPSAHLFIFRDVTVHRQLNKDFIDERIALGVLTIDNYEDITGKTESENSDLITKVRSVITKYFADKDTYLRRFRNDSYYLVTTNKKLHIMEKDKFSIVDMVHDLEESSSKGILRPTISIGIACDSTSVIRLNDMCVSALDIAMSRGGDQAVVSRYNGELVFFGGKTVAAENTGRVQLRSIGDSLRALIEGSGDVLVSGHNEADMDAIGSCFGIHALCMHLHKPCRIIFDADRTEKKARGAVLSSFTKENLQSILITSKEAVSKVTPTTLFVVVDTSVPNNVMGKDALERATKTVVIDHHRRGPSFVDNPVLQFIDTAASSACEIITGLLFYMSINPRVEIPSAYATLMLGGIFLDTNNFEAKSTTSKTFEAAQILKTYGAENSRIYDFFREDINEMRLISSCTSRSISYNNDIIYCMTDDDDIVDETTISKISNQLNHIVGVKACFVIGRVGPTTLKVSGRSDGVSINVQIICENIAGKEKGGGHFHMAAARFEGASVKIGETLLLEALRNHLDEATAYKEDKEGGER